MGWSDLSIDKLQDLKTTCIHFYGGMDSIISEVDMLTFEETECLCFKAEKRFWEAAGVGGSSGQVVSSHSERSGSKDRLQRADEGTGCLNSRKAFHWGPLPSLLQSLRRGLSFKSGSVWTSASHARWGQHVAPGSGGSDPSLRS